MTFFQPKKGATGHHSEKNRGKNFFQPIFVKTRPIVLPFPLQYLVWQNNNNNNWWGNNNYDNRPPFSIPTIPFIQTGQTLPEFWEAGLGIKYILPLFSRKNRHPSS